ncbi:MAG: SMC-Scp complex subunit ScpB [Candidatus Aenigmarchaeota archaeon]|nr:SMC-Scp complex subunit ScpB [Candidatus Aenigmarchaeota archaeon]
MAMPKKNIKHLAMLEAILFTTNEPLQLEDIRKLIKLEPETLLMLLDFLKKKYDAPESGIKLSDIGGYRLAVKQEYMEKVSHLTPHADLSRGLLRVLSLIAYHEPDKAASDDEPVRDVFRHKKRGIEENG